MNHVTGKPLLGGLAAVVFSCHGWLGAQEEDNTVEPPPIRALLVTGGASHDYTSRKVILAEGIRERVNRRIEWVTRHEGDGESDLEIPLFQNSGWADGYDIVVHDYCFPRVRAGEYIDRILAPHRAGLPALLIHGTMLSFRTPDDRWSAFTGATIRGHEREGPVSVEPLLPADPILKGFQPWAIPREELYRVESLAPGAAALIGATPTATPVAWTHRHGPANARVFATTLGNEIPTLLTPAFLDLIARGFLWALDDKGEESFKIIPPAESLAKMTLATPAEPLPRPGPSLATNARAEAPGTSPSPLLGADKATDGDPLSYWEAEGPGPASWQLDMRREHPVGAILVMWKGEAPRRYELESSLDGLSWRTLHRGIEEGMVHLSIGLDPRPMRYLRVSVSATDPGYVPGIREFAAYGQMEDMPAAFPDFATINGEPRVVLHTLEACGRDRSIRLAPGWKVNGHGVLPAGEEVIQLVPTASGEVFILAQGANEGTRKVYLGTGAGDGAITFRQYLGGLSGSALITYDGEWIYTLDGALLRAYRDTDGDGVADDRVRARELFSLSAGKTPAGLRYTAFRAGPDGWLYAVAETSEDVAGFNSRHELVRFPGHGLIRFRPTGHDLVVHASGDSAIGDVQFGEARQIAVQTAVANGDGPVIRLLPPLPGHAWQDVPDLAWPPSTADPRWSNLEAIHFGNRLYASGEGGVFPLIAEIQGLRHIAADGSRIWYSAGDKNGSGIGILSGLSGTSSEPIDWDSISTKDLFPLLSSSSRTVRTECVFEISRRKFNPYRDLEKILKTDGATAGHAGALATLSAKGGEKSVRALVEASQSTDPALQALAFQHIGDHPDLKNHLIFGEVSQTTVPSLTSAILAAMARTGTTMKGLDEMVLSLVSHPDVTLAATARAFLQDRGAVAVCFDALDDADGESAWPAAFAVLSGIRRVSVVEGIVLRLEQTRSARLRSLGIEALLTLYHGAGDTRRSWEGTPLVDLFLRASLHDHRVDRAALLRGMIAIGVPSPSPSALVELGAEDIQLEAFAVRALSSEPLPEEAELPSAALPWLETIVKSPERDPDLRTRALGVLVTGGRAEDYRRLFGEVLNFTGPFRTGEASADLMRHWLSRKDHLLQTPWLMQQSEGESGPRATLAWSTILSLISADDTPAGERATLRSHLDRTLSNEARALEPLVSALPQAGEEELPIIMAAVDRRADESVRATAREGLLDRSARWIAASSRPTVGEIETVTLAGMLATLEGDERVGRHLFRQLACDACHNLHGEGPAIGPDLANSPRLGSINELIDSVLVRGGGFAPRGNAGLYELSSGRLLSGFEAVGITGGLELRDRIGNSFSLDSDEVRIKLPLSRSGMICDTAGMLSPVEFASLVDYLKSLAR